MEHSTGAGLARTLVSGAGESQEMGRLRPCGTTSWRLCRGLAFTVSFRENYTAVEQNGDREVT